MAVKYKDYYETLGVDRSASQDEIQSAYRKLARKHHPDVAKEPESEKRFKEINEAYEVLRDPEKRTRYDTLGSNWEQGQDFRPPPGWEQSGGGFGGFGDIGGGFSDFFETLFGGGFDPFSGRSSGPGGGGTRSRRYPGGGGGFSPFEAGGFGAGSGRPADTEAEVQISLEDAYHGGKKTISLQDGRSTRTIQVSIPPGTTEGKKLRLSGQGGGAGEQRADLILTIRIRPHSEYQIRGRDLEKHLDLRPDQAALGDKVNLATLEGTIALTVPAGTSSGKKFRVRGRGLGSKGQKGDLYVVARIVTPSTLSDAQRKAYEALRKASGK